MINWNDLHLIHEPPHYQNSSDIIELESFPCHSQATEFNVQIVKDVVQKYVGHETEDERIRAKILARSLNLEYKKSRRKLEYDDPKLASKSNNSIIHLK